jgi:NTP pyrophosphatase (non-canonical NTP hydrolase)
MESKQYQEATKTFRLPEYDHIACLLGLVAEAGEVAACYQKYRRKDYTSDEFKEKLHKELGDVMWHISELSTDMGWSLESVQQGNINKLTERKQRNTIKGSGDNR